MKRQDRILGWAALAAIVVIVKGALAATWDGGAGTTNWFDGDNWNPDGLPNTNVTAQIGGGVSVELTATAGTGRGQAKELLVNQNSKLTVNDARVGAADEALFVNNGYGLRLGANNGSASGELHVAGGKVAISRTTSDVYRDSSGIIRVSGGSLTLAGGFTRIAHRNGSHDQIIVSGGVYTNNTRFAGGNGSATIDVSGGLADWIGSHADFETARDNGDSDSDRVSINVSGGELRVTNPSMRFGNGGGGGDVVVTQSGGLVHVRKNLTMAVQAGGKGNITYSISGGGLRVDGYVDMADTGATNTFEVIGANGTIDVAGNFYGLDCSNSTARFVMGADGVSPIQIGTGGSGKYLRINRKSTLELDFSSFTFSTNAIVLFEYLDDNLVDNATYGAFGTTNLSGGVRSLEIDYNYQGQKKVVATNFKRRPDGTLFWQK